MKMDKRLSKGMMHTALYILSLVTIVAGTPSGDGIRKPIVYYIQEELPIGHVVGSMVPDADLAASYTPDQLDILEYKFIANPGQLFDLTENGTLLTTSVIDRDNLCPMKLDCSVSLDIEIAPMQYFQIIKVSVVLLDINDNYPAFDDTVMHVTLSESTPVGSVIPVPMAYDPDGPGHGINHYELRVQDATARPVFRLKANDDLNDLLGEIYLEMIDHLDREEKTRYLLEIVAMEEPQSEPRQAVLLVHLSITDVNDNMPTFTQSKYSVSVPESIGVLTPLVRVIATDSDSGENSQIYYSLSGRTMLNYGSVFSVDNRTGEIFIHQPLDFELETHYNLLVVATDMSPNSLTGETVVSVEVTDVNDNAPLITVTALGELQTQIQVSENDDPDTPLSHISVRDPDKGLGGIVQCELNDTRFSLSQIYSNDFMLKATVSMDHEEDSLVNIMITCEDSGDPALISHQVIQILVTDVNDNPPAFIDHQPRAIISGNINRGETVFQVKATDPDSAQNANISYSILGNDMNRIFTIDERSGIIITKINIPASSVWDFEVEIKAEDMGTVPLSAVATVILSSAMDRTCIGQSLSPIINTTVLHVYENWPDNVTIGKLRDSTCKSDSILYPKDQNDYFTVDMNNNIVSKISFDREGLNVYCFTVMNIQTCTRYTDEYVDVEFYNIRVVIDDQNDNAPRVMFPNAENNSVMLYSGPELSAPFWLTQVIAEDPDDAHNSRLTFTFLHQDQYPHLWLDPDTGDLFLVGDITNQIDSEPIRIRIEDNGSPPLSTIASLWIIRNITTPSPAKPMVASDNLAIVLGIAVPCGFVVVLVIVVLALLFRRRFRCQKKSDRNPVNPSVDIKIKLARSASATKDEHLDTLCQELGLHIQKNITDMYPDKKFAEYSAQLEDEFGNMEEIKTKFNEPLDVHHKLPSPGSSGAMSQPHLSSRDSDSGCSADMSHSTSSTTESWQSAAQLTYNKNSNLDHSDAKQSGLFQNRTKNPYPHISTPGSVDRVRTVPNNYVQIRSGNVMYAGGADKPIAGVNYENRTYIRPEKVRKYGHINDAYHNDDSNSNHDDQASQLHRNSRMSCPVHVKRHGDSDMDTVTSDENRGPQQAFDADRHHNVSYQSPCRASSPRRSSAARHSYHDVGAQQLPSVHRSHSYSAGVCNNTDPTQGHLADNSGTNPHRDICTVNSHTGHQNHRDTNNQTNSPTKKKKIIYEAQV